MRWRAWEGAGRLQYKLDGARIQVHKAGDEVRVFSRQLNDVTQAVPEVTEAVRRLPLSDAILDGEVIALRPDGTPLPFQVTMRRFGRKLDVERLRAELPLAAFFFDILYADGRAPPGRALRRRFRRPRGGRAGEQRVRRIVTSDAGEAGAFFERAIAAGQEGLMAKALEARYDAGARRRRLAQAEACPHARPRVLRRRMGHGRRRGPALEPPPRRSRRGCRKRGFVMLGEDVQGDDGRDAGVADGEAARARDPTRRARGVREARAGGGGRGSAASRPSPTYARGLALRFARVVRYAPDKDRISPTRSPPSVSCIIEERT